MRNNLRWSHRWKLGSNIRHGHRHGEGHVKLQAVIQIEEPFEGRQDQHKRRIVISAGRVRASIISATSGTMQIHDLTPELIQCGGLHSKFQTRSWPGHECLRQAQQQKGRAYCSSYLGRLDAVYVEG